MEYNSNRIESFIRMKKTVNIKTAFLVSFTAIVLFCGLVLGAFFVYQQMRLANNKKDYQQCLSDQKEANGVAVSYIPTIKQVTMKVTTSQNDPSIKLLSDVLVKGVINNPNIERLDFVEWAGGGVDELIKTFKYDKSNGNFSYEISTPSNNSSSQISTTLGLVLTPKDNSLVCTSKSSLAKTNICTLKGINLEINTVNNSWCITGVIDMGLGSAPLNELSNVEFQTIGLSKTNICNYYPDGGAWRNKCMNKSSTIKFFPF